MKPLSNYIQENLSDNTQPIVETETSIVTETEQIVKEQATDSVLSLANIAPEKEEGDK